MGKITVILLLIYYLVPAIGLSVTSHYCGGRLASFYIFPTSAPRCSCGKKPVKKGCSNDKTAVFKIKETQNIPQPLLLLFPANFNFITYSFPLIALMYGHDMHHHNTLGPLNSIHEIHHP